MKRLLLSGFLMAGAVLSAQPGQSEFVPVTEVPAADQLPAAPLLIAAYAFVWIAVLGYVWLTWRRLEKVEQELHALSSTIAKRRP